MTLQRGIMVTLAVSLMLLLAGVCTLHSAASVGIIGGSDGPTAIYVTETELP